MKNTAAKGAVALGLLAMLVGFFSFTLWSAPRPAYAIAIVPECARCSGPECPPPSLGCALATFRNVASLIVGVTGSFALLMFVYGGFMLLTSGGVESKVTTGKTILKNAMIGIVLVFTAGYIIDYAVKSLQGRREIAAGTKCNNDEGTYTIEGGYAVCKTACAVPSRQQAGYRCLSGDLLSTATGCIADATECPGRCCLPPPPPPVNAPPEDAGDITNVPF